MSPWYRSSLTRRGVMDYIERWYNRAQEPLAA